MTDKPRRDPIDLKALSGKQRGELLLVQADELDQAEAALRELHDHAASLEAKIAAHDTIHSLLADSLLAVATAIGLGRVDLAGPAVVAMRSALIDLGEPPAPKLSE